MNWRCSAPPMFTSWSQTRYEPIGDQRHSSVVLVFCPVANAPSVFHLPRKAPSFLAGSSGCCADNAAHSVPRSNEANSNFVLIIQIPFRRDLNQGFLKLLKLLTSAAEMFSQERELDTALLEPQSETHLEFWDQSGCGRPAPEFQQEPRPSKPCPLQRRSCLFPRWV